MRCLHSSRLIDGFLRSLLFPVSIRPELVHGLDVLSLQHFPSNGGT
jgi:hypothetical protein